MALSYATTTASGNTAIVNVPFNYADKLHVHVFLDGVDQDQTTFTWLSNSQIQLASNPTAGAKVRVQRITPRDTELVDFQSGNLDVGDLNLGANLALFWAQEDEDAQDQALAVPLDQSNLDAATRKIINLADPSAAQDAATKNYVDTTASAAAGDATAAAASAAAAAASAAAAAAYIAGLSATSTTSNAVGLGSKSFTVQTGKQFTTGAPLLISDHADPTNYMHGTVTSYNSATGALVVSVLDIGGSGTKTAWDVTIAGTQGPKGDQGAGSGLSSQADGTLLANISGVSGVPDAETLNAILDHLFTPTEGDILLRGSSVWEKLSAGAAATVFTGNGAGAKPSWQVPPRINFNALRNASLSEWYHGVSGTIPTAGGWAAEGVYIVPAGASVTFAQTTPTNVSGARGYNGLQVTGASGATDVKLRFVIDAMTAAKFAGRTVTAQFPLKNGTGGSVTAKLAAKYPSAKDNWASTTTDLAATNLNAIANAASGVLALSWAVAAGAVNGYELELDLGAMGVGATFELGGGFALQVTPNFAAGIPSSIPEPFLPSDAEEVLLNQQFFYSTYDNGVAPGTPNASNNVSLLPSAATANGGTLWYSWDYQVPIPKAPRVATIYSPTTGTAGRIVVSSVDHAADIRAAYSKRIYGIDNISGVSWTNAAPTVFHFTVDGTIVGG